MCNQYANFLENKSVNCMYLVKNSVDGQVAQFSHPGMT